VSQTNLTAWPLLCRRLFVFRCHRLTPAASKASQARRRLVFAPWRARGAAAALRRTMLKSARRVAYPDAHGASARVVILTRPRAQTDEVGRGMDDWLRCAGSAQDDGVRAAILSQHRSMARLASRFPKRFKSALGAAEAPLPESTVGHAEEACAIFASIKGTVAPVCDGAPIEGGVVYVSSKDHLLAKQRCCRDSSRRTTLGPLRLAFCECSCGCESSMLLIEGDEGRATFCASICAFIPLSEPDRGLCYTCNAVGDIIQCPCGAHALCKRAECRASCEPKCTAQLALRTSALAEIKGLKSWPFTYAILFACEGGVYKSIPIPYSSAFGDIAGIVPTLGLVGTLSEDEAVAIGENLPLFAREVGGELLRSSIRVDWDTRRPTRAMSRSCVRVL
jgi:hypothetical protein